MNPNEVLEILSSGNDRYLNGNMTKIDFRPQPADLALGQHPIAAVLSCSDARVVPQFAFDQGFGKLFAVRVAGNIATPYGIASLEYAVESLKTPLIYVLGHTFCGAVDAAVKVVKDGAEIPEKLRELVLPIARAVHISESKTGDILTNAAQENVRLTVANIANSSQIIRSRMQLGILQVVGGIYDLASGKVSPVL